MDLGSEDKNSVLNAKQVIIHDSENQLTLGNIEKNNTISKNIESIYLGRNLKWDDIYPSPFADQQQLQKVKIGEFVSELNKGLFYRCASIESVILPPSIKVVDSQAFAFCVSMDSIVIGENVSQINEAAFANCVNLKKVRFKDGFEPIHIERNSKGNSAFSDCPLESVYLGRILSYDTSENGGFSPFHNKLHLSDITISSLVTELPDNIFSACINLSKIVIPNSITNIGNNAFKNTNLKEIACEAKIPPALNESFDDSTKKSAALYVPEDNVEQYKQAYEWRDFSNILPLQEYSGITDILINKDQRVKIYSINGVEVYDGDLSNAHLPVGIYMISDGKHSAKIRFAK